MTARDALADVAHQLPLPEHASSFGIASIRMHKALESVLMLHQEHPDGGQGYDAAGNYVEFDHVCTSCGTADEYCKPYPCATVTAIETALEGPS